MEITIEIEVNNDFEPCVYGCELYCPFGHMDDDYACVHLYRKDDSDWTCPVKEAMEKGRENE